MSYLSHLAHAKQGGFRPLTYRQFLRLRDIVEVAK